jgi:hypothetical protein
MRMAVGLWHEADAQIVVKGTRPPMKVRASNQSHHTCIVGVITVPLARLQQLVQDAHAVAAAVHELCIAAAAASDSYVIRAVTAVAAVFCIAAVAGCLGLKPHCIQAIASDPGSSRLEA